MRVHRVCTLIINVIKIVQVPSIYGNVLGFWKNLPLNLIYIKGTELPYQLFILRCAIVTKMWLFSQKVSLNLSHAPQGIFFPFHSLPSISCYFFLSWKKLSNILYYSIIALFSGIMKLKVTSSLNLKLIVINLFVLSHIKNNIGF